MLRLIVDNKNRNRERKKCYGENLLPNQNYIRQTDIADLHHTGSDIRGFLKCIKPDKR